MRKSKFTRLNNSDSTESHLLSGVLDMLAKLDLLFNISNLANNIFRSKELLRRLHVHAHLVLHLLDDGVAVFPFFRVERFDR